MSTHISTHKHTQSHTNPITHIHTPHTHITHSHANILTYIPIYMYTFTKRKHTAHYSLDNDFLTYVGWVFMSRVSYSIRVLCFLQVGGTFWYP